MIRNKEEIRESSQLYHTNLVKTFSSAVHTHKIIMIEFQVYWTDCQWLSYNGNPYTVCEEHTVLWYITCSKTDRG